MRSAAFVPAALLGGACTQLGPMPATTGITAMPVGRTALQAQVGVVPGFYASQSAQNEAKGAPIKHASLLLEPGRALGLPGLLVGGRVFGDDSADTPVEPYVGYRHRMTERVAVGGIAFGSAKRAEQNGASYHGTRIGGEAMIETEVFREWSWLQLRAQASVSLTRILASGRYCVDDDRTGTDCDESTPRDHVINGKTVGVYPAATAMLDFDFGKHRGWFDSAQLAFLFTAGRMPLVVDGERASTATYGSIGVTVTLDVGLGESR